jgi:hypothetical protein
MGLSRYKWDLLINIFAKAGSLASNFFLAQYSSPQKTPCHRVKVFHLSTSKEWLQTSSFILSLRFYSIFWATMCRCVRYVLAKNIWRHGAKKRAMETPVRNSVAQIRVPFVIAERSSQPARHEFTISIGDCTPIGATVRVCVDIASSR